MRCVPWGRLRKDADDNVIGIEAAAFRLRPDEAFLWPHGFSFFALQRAMSS